MVKNGLLILNIAIICLTSAWFNRIAHTSILISLILLISTIWMSLALQNKLNLKIFMLGFFCLLIFSAFLPITHFSQDLVNPYPVELNTMAARQSYYPHNLGKFIHTKYSFFLFKLDRNLFGNLSFNNYFFSGLPRYRPYALDFPKYSVLTLPFLLVGIYYFFITKLRFKIYLISLIFLIFLLMALTDQGLDLGPYPIFIVITSFISTGLFQITLNIYKEFKNE